MNMAQKLSSYVFLPDAFSETQSTQPHLSRKPILHTD